MGSALPEVKLEGGSVVECCLGVQVMSMIVTSTCKGHVQGCLLSTSAGTRGVMCSRPLAFG